MALRRGVALVFTLIGLAVLVSAAGLTLLYFLASRGPSVPRSTTLVLRPAGDLPDMSPDDVLGQILGRDGDSVRTFVESLQKAKRDTRVRAVLLMPSALESPYWAKVQELRDAVLDFRRSGKKVVAFLEYGGDREYYLASAADRVYLLPTSPLDLTGVASYEIFLRGTLDKIGAYPDFLHIGEYKTAPNQLTERGFTPAHREMSEWLNRDIYEQLVQGIADARRKSAGDVRALLDRGPFVAGEALRLGLVDGLLYEDQLDDEVPELGGADAQRTEGRDYRRVSPGSVGIRPRARIAVINASGAIVSGRSAFDPVNGAVVGSDTLVEQIRRVRDDDSVRAIVVRIDSPGGSSVASDVIWRELMITRDEKPDRPLITSMADLAASGGYYIAIPGQVIVAQPGTLTGSIGIYSGKVAIGGLLQNIGAAGDGVKDGANADIYSPFTPFTPEQRERVGDFMEDFYRGFLQKVADSRKSTPEQIDAVARGRVWTGRQARERGLVDELGGLDTAIAIAKRRAKIPEDEDVEIVMYPARRGLFDALSDVGAASSLHPLLAVLTGAERRTLAAATAPVRLFRRGEPLALMPFAEIR